MCACNTVTCSVSRLSASQYESTALLHRSAPTKCTYIVAFWKRGPDAPFAVSKLLATWCARTAAQGFFFFCLFLFFLSSLKNAVLKFRILELSCFNRAVNAGHYPRAVPRTRTTTALNLCCSFCYVTSHAPICNLSAFSMAILAKSLQFSPLCALVLIVAWCIFISEFRLKWQLIHYVLFN